MEKQDFLQKVITYLKNADPDALVIYVAGKVTGLPYSEVYAKFKARQLELESEGATVLNPIEFIEPAENWPIAMRMAITLLNMADAVSFLPDWEDSEGAKMEFQLALKLGIATIHQ